MEKTMKFGDLPSGHFNDALQVIDGKLHFPMYATVDEYGRFELNPQMAYEFFRRHYEDLPPHMTLPPDPEQEPTDEDLKNMGDVKLVGCNVVLRSLGVTAFGFRWRKAHVYAAAGFGAFLLLFNILLLIRVLG